MAVFAKLALFKDRAYFIFRLISYFIDAVESYKAALRNFQFPAEACRAKIPNLGRLFQASGRG